MRNEPEEFDPEAMDALVYGDTEEVDYEAQKEADVSAERVSWHMRKAASWDAQQTWERAIWDHQIALIEEQWEKLEAGKKAAMEKLQAKKDWHLETIEAWHRAAFAAGRVPKTFEFPHGISTLTKERDETIINESAFKAWAADVEVELEDGETASLVEIAYPEPTPKEPEFRITKLKAVAKTPDQLKKDAEEGTMLPLVMPDGDIVEGVKIRVSGNRFGATFK